jgi:hypothetical protein
MWETKLLGVEETIDDVLLGLREVGCGVGIGLRWIVNIGDGGVEICGSFGGVGVSLMTAEDAGYIFSFDHRIIDTILLISMMINIMMMSL